MTHTISYDPQTRVIEMTASGVVDLNELHTLLDELLHLSAEKNTRLFLSNYLDIKRQFTLLELFDVPDYIAKTSEELGLHAVTLKRAVVMRMTPEDQRFFENINFNRGHNAKIFTDLDDARSWLLSNDSAL